MTLNDYSLGLVVGFFGLCGLPPASVLRASKRNELVRCKVRSSPSLMLSEPDKNQFYNQALLMFSENF